jgi:hypothetical protein
MDIFFCRKAVLLFFLTMASFLLQCARSKELLNYSSMENYAQQRWEHDSTILVIAGNSENSTRNIALESGKYSMMFMARGSMSREVLPHFVIAYGPFTIKDMEIGVELKTYSVNFELPQSVNAPIRFIFDNDYSDSTGDRNIFLYFPIVIKPF